MPYECHWISGNNMQLTYTNLHDYQKRAVQFLLDRPRSMLFMDMGLGKTPTVLTTTAHLIDRGLCQGVLVIAPKRVCETVWEAEARKWGHTDWLSFSLIGGNKDERCRALRKHAHFYLVNYENLPWLVSELNVAYLSKGRRLPFDTLVLDEVTRLKSSRAVIDEGSVRGEALQRILPYIDRRIGLTGTPAPNGLSDLFGQYLLLDDGHRLGRDMLAYHEKYFQQFGYKWHLRQEGKDQIHQLIADMTLEMKSKDYLTLPPVIENIVQIDLPLKVRKQYEELERALFLELDSGATIEAVNAAVLLSKCLQISNGAVYHTPQSKEWDTIHDLKLDALEEIFDSGGQKPLLIAYQFRHDKEKILKKFKDRGIIVLDGKVGERDALAIVERWNKGEIPMLLGNAQSIGHGINIQFGGNQVVWFGLGYALEPYLQFNARLERQGQPGDHVMIHKILCRDTVDFAVLDALKAKSEEQQDLRESLNQYRRMKNL